MVLPKILLPVFFFPRSFWHNCLKNPPPELLPPWHYFSLVLPPDSPSPHNSSCFQLNRDCSRSLCQTLLPMQPHVCNWNSAAVPATPGSERAREPESQGERGEHQDASRNTDREISAFLQKHSTNRALNYCAVSHFDQVLQLEFNNWHLSCAHVHIYDICTCAQTCHGQTVVHLCSTDEILERQCNWW